MFRDRTLYYNRVWGMGYYALYLESKLGDITLQGSGAAWAVTVFRRFDGDSKIVFERTLKDIEPARRLALAIAAELDRMRPNDWGAVLGPITTG